MSADSQELLKAFSRVRIGVLGDVMLDRFLFGNVRRISPEAPVPVVSIERESVMLGGAANVAANIAALGGHTSLLSVIGSDQNGRSLISIAKKSGITCKDIFMRKEHYTTQKTRVVGSGQHIVRIDQEMSEPVSGRFERALLVAFRRALPLLDVVIVSDYGKGVVTPWLAQEVVRLARLRGKKVLVDAKPSQLPYLKGAFLFTPNHHEASALAGNTNIQKAGALLRRRLEGNILITQGIDGMTLFERSSSTHIPAQARSVFDVVGAGDTVTAVCAMALAAGADIRHAASIANCAAGIVVSKQGTATITLDELRAALV